MTGRSFAAFLLALAIEKAGSNDRTKVAAALRSVATAPGEPILPGELAKALGIQLGFNANDGD